MAFESQAEQLADILEKRNQTIEYIIKNGSKGKLGPHGIVTFEKKNELYKRLYELQEEVVSRGFEGDTIARRRLASDIHHWPTYDLREYNKEICEYLEIAITFNQEKENEEYVPEETPTFEGSKKKNRQPYDERRYLGIQREKLKTFVAQRHEQMSNRLREGDRTPLKPSKFQQIREPNLIFQGIIEMQDEVVRDRAYSGLHPESLYRKVFNWRVHNTVEYDMELRKFLSKEYESFAEEQVNKPVDASLDLHPSTVERPSEAQPPLAAQTTSTAQSPASQKKTGMKRTRESGEGLTIIGSGDEIEELNTEERIKAFRELQETMKKAQDNFERVLLPKRTKYEHEDRSAEFSAAEARSGHIYDLLAIEYSRYPDQVVNSFNRKFTGKSHPLAGLIDKLSAEVMKKLQEYYEGDGHGRDEHGGSEQGGDEHGEDDYE